MPPTMMNMPPQMVPPPQHNMNPNMIGGPPGMPPMMPPPVMNPSIPNRGPGLSEDHRGIGIGGGSSQLMDKRNDQAPQGWRSRDTREKERDYRERDRKSKIVFKNVQEKLHKFMFFSMK